MQNFESKPADEWNAHDRLIFALAGLSNIATSALKENLNPPYGWTDDYPDRLLDQLEFWIENIRKIRNK